jgi:LysM repeat protein
MHRRTRKIRRTGRHTTPSQVEKVAEKAGKAAPAVAIAGVLVAGPAASAAMASPAKASTVAVQVHKARTTARTTARITHIGYAAPAGQSYVVQSGDTLAGIAQKFYGNYNDWTRIYQANSSVISNPNRIFPGERLQIPSGARASGTTAHHATHQPRHAKPAAAPAPAATLTSATVPHGRLSCTGLEQLWTAAGGAAGSAHMAAEIAMAESGGNQFAYSPTNDRGYWQINGSWGPLSTFDALGNAKAAVHISSDGHNWSPWTTYTSGAYYGRC